MGRVKQDPALAAVRAVVKEELRQLSDATLPLWLEKALTYQEIKEIQVYQYLDAFFSKKTKLPLIIGRGTPTERIDETILNEYHAGTYVFQALGIDGFFWATRVETIGKPQEMGNAQPSGPIRPGPIPMGPMAAPEDTQAVLDSVLKQTLTRKQLMGLISDLDGQELQREVGPLKNVAELIAALKPQGDGNEKLLHYVMTEAAETRKLLLEMMVKGQAPGAAPSKDAFSESLETMDRVTQLAGRLGFTRAAGAAGSDSMWTPEAVTSIISTAAPLLRDAWDGVKLMWGARQGHAGPPARVVEGSGEAVEPVPAGAEKGANVGHMDESNKELVEIAFNALRGKDFKSLRAVYESVQPLTGGVLPDLDPAVNAAVYIALLKRFDPRFGTCREEWGLFMDWLREQEEGEGAPHGDAGQAA